MLIRLSLFHNTPIGTLGKFTIALFLKMVLVGLCIGNPIIALAIEPVSLRGGEDRISLGDAAQFFDEQRLELDIASLLAQTDSLQWQLNGRPEINLGYVQHPHWFRVAVKNDTDVVQERLLELAYALHSRVDFYVVNQQGNVDSSYQIDNTRSDPLKPIHHRYFVIPAELPPRSITIFYIRIETTGSMKAPLTLWADAAFSIHNQKVDLVLGGLYGICLVMALYNLVLYLFIREKSYLYYVIYVFSWLMLQAALEGTTQQYILPGGIGSIKLTVLLGMSLGCFGVCSFSREFLQLYRYPNVDFMLKLFLLAFAIAVPACFIFHYSVMVRILAVMSLLLSITMCGLGYWTWYQGVAQAKLFALGWTSFLVGMIVLPMDHMGIIPSSMFTRYAASIGSVIELVLLSVALADRYKYIRQEKIRAQREAIDNLRKADTLKSEFLATISHELRTPMIGILGYLEMLKDRKLTSDSRADVVGIEKSATEMMAMVDRILDFAQLKAGILRLEYQRFDLLDLIAEVRQTFTHLCHAKGLTFECDVKEDVPPLVYADAKKLHDVLCGLLDNAVKFTDQGSVKLTVKALPKGSASRQDDNGVDEQLASTGNSHVDQEQMSCCYLFRISDSGCGIEDADRQKIFTAFAQLDGSFSREYDGMGLGLSMCRHYVHLMDGDLTLISNKGEGSRFDVILDLALADPEKLNPSQPVTSTLAEIVRRKPLVLVVEDNITNQVILSRMLENFGLRVLVADNGDQALQILASQSVELIFMDCQMPGMNGFDTTKTIRAGHNGALESCKDIPIIAVTANVMSGDQDRCFAAGMNDYLKKPVSKKQIKDKIEIWLTR